MNKLLIVFLVVVAAFLACTKDKTPPSNSSETTSDCTDTIRYSVEIENMINTSCISCHDTGGTSPNLSDYSRVSSNASAVYGSINSGSMPSQGDKLSDSIIQNMECWINQGSLNN
jgi:cytochrome c553